MLCIYRCMYSSVTVHSHTIFNDIFTFKCFFLIRINQSMFKSMEFCFTLSTICNKNVGELGYNFLFLHTCIMFIVKRTRQNRKINSFVIK